MCADQCSVMMRGRQRENDVDAPFRARSNQGRVTLRVQFPLDLLQAPNPRLDFDQDDAQR